jgi:hypothetical protein
MNDHDRNQTESPLVQVQSADAVRAVARSRFGNNFGRLSDDYNADDSVRYRSLNSAADLQSPQL